MKALGKFSRSQVKALSLARAVMRIAYCVLHQRMRRPVHVGGNSEPPAHPLHLAPLREEKQSGVWSGGQGVNNLRRNVLGDWTIGKLGFIFLAFWFSMFPPLCGISLCSTCWAGPYFRDSGLVDIPTGKVVEHGAFNVGTYFAFRSDDELPRDEAAIRFDFGLFDRVEIGLTTARLNQISYLSGNLKVLLFREADTVPSVAIGIENVGDRIGIESGLDDLTRYERKSTFLAISKTFNLPRIHQIAGHIGIGNHRFVEELGISKTLNGVFFGISKDFQPAFARGDLTFSIEVDGRGVNTGVRHTANSGLQVYIGAEVLNAPATEGKEIRYLVGVAWTNRALMKRIEEAKRLAKRAALIANKAKQAAEEDKE